MTTALVIGGAASLWNDIDRALEIGSYDAVVACNDAGAAWPGKLDAIVSLHGEKLGLWTERRALNGFASAERVVAHQTARNSTLRLPPCITEFAEYKFEGQADSGSSGLFALKYALIDLGHDKAVLCGVPMTRDAGHFFDLRPWGGWQSHRRGWNQALPVIKDRARSMSGWTRELLGAPDESWMAD